MKKTVSVVIPCYNEESNIMPLTQALKELFSQEDSYSWRVIMIDDGSRDTTLETLRNVHQNDERFGYIALSRNFGKERALLAGLDNANGDCTVIMDADLQHPPVVISDMLREWEKGAEDVYAERKSRGRESFIRRKMSQIYYRLLEALSESEVLPNVGDFRLLDRKCVMALRQLRESERYTKGMFAWIGYRKASIKFKTADRFSGKSSFNYSRLINLAIEGITSHSTLPLRISSVFGFFVSLFAFIYMCYVLVKTILIGEPTQGFPTLIIVILFIGGIQLLSIGIIGEYIGRIFKETKHRPSYLIEEENL